MRSNGRVRSPNGRTLSHASRRMIELAITLVICGTVLYVAHLYRPQRLAERPLDGAPIKRELPPVPNDLLLQANKWHDAWAREQALKNMQELYETTGDWDRVRYVYSQMSIEDGEN